MPVDFCKIEVISGNGGDGAVSFWREKFVPFGGPDGGNGGNGGSIIIKSSDEINSLSFLENKKIVAKNGENGFGGNKNGKNAEDVIIYVPVGTVVFDEKNNVLCDLDKNNFSFIIARGGKGGRGNNSFKNSRIKAPKVAENGYPGEHKKIILRLKIIAEVGLLGFPNVGKSTFLSVVTNAKPKIGDYPFTTLTPNIGIVKNNEYEFSITDLPGIIEKAHEGKGLGHIFLQHLKRCKIIIFLISSEDENYFNTFKIIENEIEKFDKTLLKKKIIVSISKCDLENYEEKKKELEKKIKKSVFAISSIKKIGIIPLLDECAKNLEKIRETEKKIVTKNYIAKKENIYDIVKKKDNEWEVFSEYILNNYLNNKKNKINNIEKIFCKLGINKQLKEKGAKKDDVIRFSNLSFFFKDDEK